MTAIAGVTVTMLTGYAAIGLAFAILFAAVGIHRVDKQAKGSGIGFRLITLPAVAALWPCFSRAGPTGGSESLRTQRASGPCRETPSTKTDPHWHDLVLFNEYFHGDDGSGVGASHQTAWTGIVAKAAATERETT